MKNKRMNSSDVFFINYDLRVEEKKALKAMVEKTPDKVFDLFEQAVADGYSITIKHDEYNDCTGAFMRNTLENGHNQGLILTGRGKNAFGAIAGVLYRHYLLFQGDWDLHRGKQGSVDFD